MTKTNPYTTISNESNITELFSTFRAPSTKHASTPNIIIKMQKGFAEQEKVMKLEDIIGKKKHQHLPTYVNKIRSLDKIFK